MSRLEQAVHYIVASTSPEELGKVKLAKALFFADLESFRLTGESISGAIYEKRQHGPMPRRLYEAVDHLSASGKIAQRRADRFGFEQHQFWSLEQPTLDEFTARDVATLHKFTRAVCDKYTAKSISNLTHNAAWELAGTGEEIPLAAFLAAWNKGQPLKAEIEAIEAALGEATSADIPAR